MSERFLFYGWISIKDDLQLSTENIDLAIYVLMWLDLNQDNAFVFREDEWSVHLASRREKVMWALRNQGVCPQNIVLLRFVLLLLIFSTHHSNVMDYQNFGKRPKSSPSSKKSYINEINDLRLIALTTMVASCTGKIDSLRNKKRFSFLLRENENGFQSLEKCIG